MSSPLFAQDAPADLLKQLEQRLQTLVQQRTQLREELDQLKQDRGSQGAALGDLKAQVEALTAERDGLLRAREEVRAQVEAILGMLEALG